MGEQNLSSIEPDLSVYHEMHNPGVIVLGGHVQGLGIIRIYGENGIPCILLDDTSINIGRHSRYCLRFFKYPRGALLNYLLDFSRNTKYRNWLLIPTNDYQVEVLSKNKDELGKYYEVGTGDWELVKKCYNKKLTYQIAMDCKIDIPYTYFPKNIAELENTAIKYPCIIKPAVMYKFYSKLKKKVLKCNNKTELIKNHERAQEAIPSDEIIVQEIIPGDSENQYSACFLYDGDKPLVSLAARRKRQHPIDFGNATTFAETVFDYKLIEISKILLNKINYYGLCEVEFKYDNRDGKYKLLEINPRSWKWHYIAKATSTDFLLNLYKQTYDITCNINNSWNEAIWSHLITDIFVRVVMICKGRRIGKSLINKNIVYAVFDKNDLKPFIYEKIYFPYLLISR